MTNLLRNSVTVIFKWRNEQITESMNCHLMTTFVIAASDMIGIFIFPSIEKHSDPLKYTMCNGRG